MYLLVMNGYYDLAERQYGVFNLEQTRWLGISDDVVFRSERSDDLVREFDSVYRISGVDPRFETRCMAATLTSPEVVVSHGAARALLGMPDCHRGRVEVTVPLGSNLVLPGVIVHHSRHLDPVDRTRRGRIRVTTPTRALIDSASQLSIERMYQLMDWSFLHGHSSPDLLLERLGAINGRGRKGTRLVRALVADYIGNGVPRSVFERRFREACFRNGVRVPQQNVIIDTRIGPIEVDNLWSPEGLIAETDGRSFHDMRLQAEKDAKRRAALVAVGLSVMVVRYPRLRYQETELMRDVADSLRIRRRIA